MQVVGLRVAEQKFKKIRIEMSEVMAKMSELYAMFRMCCIDVSLEAIQEPLLAAENRGASPRANTMVSFEQAMADLEGRLMRLTQAEKSLAPDLDKLKRSSAA